MRNYEFIDFYRFIKAVLRFSIQWNEEGNNNIDFDAHAYEPNGNHIYFIDKGERHASSGMLDVDIIYPEGKVAVENIIWTNLNTMRDGTYKMVVHNYSSSRSMAGFKAEIELADGTLKEYVYNNKLSGNENVVVATVTLKDGEFTVNDRINSDTSLKSKTVWNLETNKFHPVGVVCLSPNFWNGKGIGNKHFIFSLKDCMSEESHNGFYNEFLNQYLYEHRKVFEALASEMRLEDCDNAISGVGFSETRRNDVIVKVKGSTERVMKIIF